MTVGSSRGGSDAASAWAAASVAVRPSGWFRSEASRRISFGYVLLLVAGPFVFSLYLALSDANVGDPVASFIGLENFRAALETEVFYTALRNSIVFTLVSAVLKGFLGTTL